MTQTLDTASVRIWLEKLADHLSRNDRQALETLLGLSGTRGQVPVATALAALHPGASLDNGNAYLRQLRGRVNSAAQGAGVPLHLAVSAGKKLSPEKRFLWFQGEDPVRELAQEFRQR